MEDNKTNSKLSAVILLLIGFIIGFLTNSLVGPTETSPDDVVNGDEVVIDEDLELEDGSTPESMGDDTDSDSFENIVSEEIVIESTPNNVAANGYEISVQNQKAGSVVLASSLVIENDSWLGVRDDRSILGVAWFPAGSHENVTVELQRDTEAGSAYKALIYSDDGFIGADNHKVFDFDKDLPVNGEDGKTYVVEFTAF